MPSKRKTQKKQRERRRPSANPTEAKAEPTAAPGRYWFPYLGWYSPPAPEILGSPGERDKLHGELGALTYRWSATARETGDLDLMFVAQFLWAALAVWGKPIMEDTDGPTRALGRAVEAFLAEHAEAWRTDNISIDAVFEWDSIHAARARSDLALPPLQAPTWFPVWTPDSIAYGLITIAERFFATKLSPEERQGFPLRSTTRAEIATLMIRYVSWCVPRITNTDDLAGQLAERLKSERVQNAKRCAKVAVLFLAECAAPAEPGDARTNYMAEARANADRLFDGRLGKRANRAKDVMTSAVAREVQQHVDQMRATITTAGGFFVVPLVRLASFFRAGVTTAPDHVAAHFVDHFTRGRFVGDHRKQESLERVRDAMRKKITDRLRRDQPGDAVALAETVCGALGLPLRELCREHFDAWVKAALESQAPRTP